MRKFFYNPPNWLVAKFSSEDRRMFGFWTIVVAIIGTITLKVISVGNLWWLLWLTVLSIVALIPNFASETPVEEEES